MVPRAVDRDEGRTLLAAFSSLLLVVGLTRGRRAARGRSRRLHGQRDRLREPAAGHRPVGMGRRWRRRRVDPGFRHPDERQSGREYQFKIETTATAYTIEIYRLGYYQGNGARKIATVTPSATLPQNQPACATDPDTEIYDCGTWGVSASWAVPSTAVSGVYIARLHRPDNNDASHIPFIVRNDAQHVTGRLSDVRLHVAGLQHLWRFELLPGYSERTRIQTQLQPPVRDPGRGDRPGLSVLQ